MLNKKLVVAILAFFAMSACGASGAALERRASFDLKCKPTELRWTKLDSGTWGVRGCGTQATYVKSCSRTMGNYSSCTWIRNN